MKRSTYQLEFYNIDQGVEFSVRFPDEDAYEVARRFLEGLASSDAAGRQSSSRGSGAGVDVHVVDDAQYRAFRAFMRRTET